MPNTKSLHLNGSSQWASTTTLWDSDNKNCTFECWFKSDDYTQKEQTIFTSGRGTGTAGGADGFSILLNNHITTDGSIFLLRHAVAFHDTGDNVSDNDWHHLAVVLDSNGYPEIFLDGVSIFTVSSFVGTPVQGVAIGTEHNGSGGTRYFNGKIDDFRVWSDERTQGEIDLNRYGELSGTEPNLVSYYKLADDLTDETSTANNLTDNGTVLYDTSLPFDDADENTHSIDLEASSSQYLSITGGDQTGLNFTGDFSFEAWVKLESSGITQMILAKDSTTGGTGRAWGFYIDSGNKLTLEYFANDSTHTIHASTNSLITEGLATGEWHHLAVTADVSAKTVLMYLNSSSISVTQVSSNASAVANVATKVAIGARDRPTGSPSGFLDGLIDEVRAWNDIRTGTEISDNYQDELVGNEAGLVAYWRLNNNCIDKTSNGNILTPNASPVFSTDLPFIALITKALAETITLVATTGNKAIITLSEIISLISGIIHKAGKQLNETINPVATFTSISTILRVFTEIISIGAIIKNKTVKTISETISTVDSVLCKLSKQLNESINIVSSFSSLGTFLKTFLETVSITDILKNKAQKTFSEVLSLADLIKNKTVRLFTETLSLTDSIVRKTVRLFSEVVSITDILKNKIQKTFSEVITTVDTTIIKTYKLFSETLSLVDSIKNKISKTFSETLSVTASIIKKITLDLLELIGITSTFSKLSTIIRSFSETISLTDWWKYGKTLSKGISILSTVVNKSITSLKTKGASILGTKNKDKTTL